MKHESISSLVNRFCSRDKGIAIGNPSKVEWRGEGYVCATNGYSLILVPDTEMPDVVAVDKFPVISKVLQENIQTPTSPKFLTKELLLSTFSAVERVNVFKDEKCPDCGGDGEFWHGRHEYDCKECDGSGVVDGEFVGKEYSGRVPLRIGDAYFSTIEIGKLLDVIETIGSDAIILTNPSPDETGAAKPSLFCVENCYVLIIPKNFHEGGECINVVVESEASNG